MLRRALALLAMSLAAGGAVAACNLLEKSCTLVGCTDGPQVAVELHQSFDDVVGSAVTTCFNGACTTTTPRDSIRNLGIDASSRPRQISYEGGQVIDHGEGWTELSLYVPRGPFSNGDRYRVAIVKADGARLIDLERNFIYTIDQPNGSECNPTCHSALARLYEASPSGLTCGGRTCFTGVSVRARIPTNGSYGAILTLCRNSVCSTADGGLVQRFLTLQGELPSTLTSVERDGVFEISMYMFPESALLADGDVYRVRIVDPYTGAVLKAAEKSVTYDAVFPNSVECDVVPCREAVVELD